MIDCRDLFLLYLR